MGYGGVGDVRQGKFFELDVAADSTDAARALAGEVVEQAARQPGHRELSRSRCSVMKFAVVVFPGSNCDHDAYHAAKHVLGQEAEFIWHKDTDLKGADVVILPGGFAHGDYLRTGAIARFSPSWSGRGVRRGRRPGARHLQRLPDPARGGPARGRDAPQPRRCSIAASTSASASSSTDTPFTSACQPGRCCASRSRTAKATTTPSPRCSSGSRRTGRSSSATSTAARRDDRRGQPERRAATTSPASATSAATWSA